MKYPKIWLVTDWHKNTYAVAKLSWLECPASDRKVAGSMPILGIALLYPWERRLKQIS